MELLHQRFNYAIISVAKDYCTLDERGRYSKSYVQLGNQNFTDADSDLFDSLDKVFDIPIKVLSQTKRPLDTSLAEMVLYPKKGKQRTQSFYLEDDAKSGTRIPIMMFNGFREGNFLTTDDRHIKKHYGRPFSSITVVTIDRTVKLENGKLVCKAAKTTRYRGFNKKYFKKKYHSESLTFDMVTGNFTVGETNVHRGKPSTRFRKNLFALIERIIVSNNFFNFKNTVNKNDTHYFEFIKEIDDGKFVKCILEQLGKDPSSINDLGNNQERNELLRFFIEFFVGKKQIKVPNNYYDFIRLQYPGERYLKKNKRKLIMSILDSYGIKSKLLNKLVHENPLIDISELKHFASFFGKDFNKYFGNLNENVLKLFQKKDASYVSAGPINERRRITVYNLDDDEKENIIKITNSLIKPDSTASTPLRAVSGLYGLFRDHIDMATKLREYDPSFKMRATNYDEFHTEHLELTKLISTIKKGWSQEYVYDNRTVRKIESPIEYEFEGKVYQFIPTILKRDEEYSEEGAFMHHCVATYANKTTSMIVSIRFDSGKDRVTCEYDKKTGDVIQERHFCNRIPPDFFNKALRIVSDRIKNLRYSRMLDHIDIKKVRVKINGKEVPIPQTQGGQNIIEDPFGF